MTEVTILSRTRCHLCHVVAKMAHSIQAEVSFKLSLVDIDGHPDLIARYGLRIPVVLIDQVERLSGKITEGELRRAIKRARWRRPISRILSRFGLSPPRG